MELNLLLPSFIAGIFTFLAPCTLPMVPGFLSFISGVALDKIDGENSAKLKSKIFYNALLYVTGFSLVFIVMGMIVGFGGALLIQYRVLLSQIGGLCIIFFGLYMLHVFDFSFLKKEHRVKYPKGLTPGNPLSSFIFGATFALGWTPCVGPILGSVLLLASSSATVFQGGFYLLSFSLGLGLPFLLIALSIGWFSQHLQKFTKYLNIISIIGGVFLVILGIFMLTNQYGILLGYIYTFLSFLRYEEFLFNWI